VSFGAVANHAGADDLTRAVAATRATAGELTVYEYAVTSDSRRPPVNTPWNCPRSSSSPKNPSKRATPRWRCDSRAAAAGRPASGSDTPPPSINVAAHLDRGAAPNHRRKTHTDPSHLVTQADRSTLTTTDHTGRCTPRWRRRDESWARSARQVPHAKSAISGFSAAPRRLPRPCPPACSSAVREQDVSVETPRRERTGQPKVLMLRRLRSMKRRGRP